MKKFIIPILCILVIGLGGFIVYDKVLKEPQKENDTEIKENKENKETTNEITKIDENKDLYYFEDEEPVATFNECFEGYIINDYDSKEECEIANKGKQFIYQYPVININTNEIKKLNEKLKAKANDEKNNFIKYLEDDGVHVSVKLMDGTIKYTKGYTELKYNIQSGKYLTIITGIYTKNFGGGGYEELEDAYVIDTEKGKILTKNEILEIYNFSEKDIVNEISKIKSEIEFEFGDQYANQIITELSNNNYDVFLTKNEDLVIRTDCEIPGEEIFIYDKSNWKIKSIDSINEI